MMKNYWIAILIVVAIFLMMYMNEKMNDDLFDRLNLVSIPKKYDKRIQMNDLFDRIYLIAIPERRNYAFNSLDSFNINPILIEPVLKGNLNHEEIIKDGVIDPDLDYKNMGRVACHLSHLKTLSIFLKDSLADTAIIFEDDIEGCLNYQFYQRRLSSLKKEMKSVKGVWDIIYLGSYHSSCHKFSHLTTQIYKGGGPLARHAYAVTKKGAKIILSNTIPMFMAGDVMMKKLGESNMLKVLTVVPPIFYQNRTANSSTIGNNNVYKHCIDSSINLNELSYPFDYRSQIGQDKYINDTYVHNHRNGIFVDVGAFDGEEFSNSYFFEKSLGWTGICIEPQPDQFQKLKEKRDCISINAAAFNKDTTIQLRQTGSNPMLSGIVGHHNVDMKKVSQIQTIDIPTVQLKDLFQWYNITTVDYLSVDTEGSELEVLKGIDWDNVHINIINVEHNNEKEKLNKIIQFLSQKGFVVDHYIKWDVFFKNKHLKWSWSKNYLRDF